MRSLRLDPELDDKVRRAAAVEESSVSEFLRQAAEERADRVLGARPSEQLNDVVGAIHGGGGRAKRTGKAFAEQLASKRR